MTISRRSLLKLLGAAFVVPTVNFGKNVPLGTQGSNAHGQYIYINHQYPPGRFVFWGDDYKPHLLQGKALVTPDGGYTGRYLGLTTNDGWVQIEGAAQAIWLSYPWVDTHGIYGVKEWG